MTSHLAHDSTYKTKQWGMIKMFLSPSASRADTTGIYITSVCVGLKSWMRKFHDPEAERGHAWLNYDVKKFKKTHLYWSHENEQVEGVITAAPGEEG